jgi:CheY-like chemotaxis protein
VPRRILLVHDDLAEIAAVRRALAAEGDEVLLATNASDALAALAADPLDAVLLAPECDGGDGAAVAREVGGATPVILIGGDAAAAFRVRRPLEADEVREVVASALRSAPAATSTATPTRRPPPPVRPEPSAAESSSVRPEPSAAESSSVRPEPSAAESSSVRPERSAAESSSVRPERSAAESKGPPPRPPTADVTALLSSRDAGAAELRALLEAEAELRRSSAALDAERRRAVEEEERRRAAALAWVAAKLEQVRRADYFAILDLATEATPEDVREATRRILSEAAADRFGPGLPEGLTDDLAELREVVSEAGEVLADPELRARYRAAIAPPVPRE